MSGSDEAELIGYRTRIVDISNELVAFSGDAADKSVAIAAQRLAGSLMDELIELDAFMGWGDDE